MSRILRISVYVLGGLAGVFALTATLVYFGSASRLKKTFNVTPLPVEIPGDAALLAHGRHLAQTRGCNDCHGKDYAGGKVIDDGAMGRLYGPNLTRGQGGRIASFTDQDWVRAIRHGVGPDGLGLLIMPSEEYSHLSDHDLGALIAFLKSLPATDREQPATALGPVSRVLLATGKMKLSAETIDHANLRPRFVPAGATVDYGRYVANSCTGCHGPNFAGGKIAVGPPNWPEAANLTPDASGNLAKWSEADFTAALRTGKRPDGSELSTVMPRAFGDMNDTEMKALYAFFKSLPAIPKGSR